MSDVILALREVRKSYGGEVPVEVLHGIDLEIRKGELVALVGPSGSGKSTLLNQIGLLDRPTSGTIEVLGRDTSGLDDEAITRMRGEALGFIFQFHHLLPALSVAENVMLPAAAMNGGFAPAMSETAHSLLDAMGLGDRMDARPRELSGGMQQRVAIARALMNNPPLVLADEPTGNLDTATSDRVFALLKSRNEEQSTAFLIVTHDESLAARCGRVIKIVDGKIVGDGDPSNVL